MAEIFTRTGSGAFYSFTEPPPAQFITKRRIECSIFSIHKGVRVEGVEEVKDHWKIWPVGRKEIYIGGVSPSALQPIKE